VVVKHLVSLLLAICCLLLPAVAVAMPVGAITNDAGIRIGMKDIPERGDYPLKIHSRYCAEDATYAAARESILVPNGISNDRRMPAGEVLDVRCKSLRSSWKAFPVYAAEGSSPLLKQVNAKLNEANAKLVSIEKEMVSLKASIADIPPTVQRNVFAVYPQAVPWWKSTVFWNFVILAVIILLLLAALAGQPYYQRTVLRRNPDPLAGPLERGTVARDVRGREAWVTDATYRSVWTERADDLNEARVYVAVGTASRDLRLFRYLVPRTTTEGYRLIHPGESKDLQVIADQVLEAVDRYIGNVPWSSDVEKRYVEAAIADGRLKEIRPSRGRPAIL